MSTYNHYDIVFVGWGASTCILIIEMEKQSLLKGKNILIIDPNEKKENDKTFCFWSKKEDEIYQNFKTIVSKSWNSIQINDNKSCLIDPLEYFHIDCSDLYSWSRKIASEYNISHVKESVLKVDENLNLAIQTDENNYSASWVFDSRPPDLENLDEDNFNISQSFYGLKVKLFEAILDPSVYRMMDFRVPQNTATQFVYILPYSSNSALIELTRFGKKIINKSEAKKELDVYIRAQFGSYEIIDTEQGIIPMSSKLPRISSGKKWISIGTRAGNVKPSTGYAFKNMYRHAQLICSGGTLKAHKLIPKRRFLFYDQLLLIILTLWPSKGKLIFERLFTAKSPVFVLNFLDEKTSFKDDLSMFYKLQIGLFVQSLLYWIYWRIKDIFFPILMIIYILFDHTVSVNSLLNLSYNNVVVLSLGMFFLGIPHGALDHLTGPKNKTPKVDLSFIAYYLLMMLPILLLWIYIPIAGLTLFLIYSAWHFGQTEMKNWKIESKFLSFCWGTILLSSIFLNHFQEFSNILLVMSIKVPQTHFDTVFLANMILTLPLLYACYKRNLEWLLIIVFLFLSSEVSLLLTFGLYFIFQHSRIGWLHLKKKTHYTHLKMFQCALPFNIGALLMYVIFIYILKLDVEQCVAYFFIFISAISFPHVIKMHIFYENLSLLSLKQLFIKP
jgi:lycopene beta-cyclase